MSAKDNLAMAFQRRRPAAVPVWEIEFHCWDAASGRHVVLGREFEALTESQKDKALHENAEIILSVCREFSFAGLTPPGGYWEVAPGQPAYLWLPPEWRWRQTELLARLAGDEIMLVGNAGGVLGMPGARNYLEFSYKLYDAPEEIDELARNCLKGGLANARRLRDLGVGAVFSASDIADNHGPFYNPAQMDRFILPYLRRWAEGVRELGLYSILHTDGNLDAIMDGIAASGLDALQALDPIAGMDIRKTKARYGDRLCLCGNIDCGLLDFGPATKVYQTTADLLGDIGGSGGFVLGASNAVFQEMPVAHYRAMIQAWRDYGRLRQGDTQ